MKCLSSNIFTAGKALTDSAAFPTSLLACRHVLANLAESAASLQD